MCTEDTTGLESRRLSPASHMVYMSHPQATADVILDAVSSMK